MEYKGLPIFKASIGDADGMVVCSFVDDPAVESQFLAYAKDEKPMQFSIENEDKHIVIGVAMRANFPIYRYNASMGEFYIVYTPEVIREMVQKFFRNGYQNNVDVDHSFQLEDGVYIEQAFIKDTENGINPKGFDEIEDGSLFFQYKVENDEIWNGIKDGTFKGFSIAGTFGIEETYTKQDNNNNEEKYNKTMSKLNRIKEVLKSLLVEFGEVSTDKGVIVFDGDELEAGMEVKGIDEQGNEIELEDGEYRTEDKKVIVVESGRVVEIKDDEAEVATDEPAEEPADEPQENAEDDPAIEPAEEPEQEPETDDRDALIEELRARIAELETENAELKQKLEESAAPSASEAFEKLDAEDNSEAGKLRKRGYKF